MLAVWLIYAADRVLDAWNESSHLPRHEFYRSYWRSVLPIWAAVLALAGWLAWTRLSSSLFQQGILVLALVALYFGVVHLAPAALRHAWPKEAAVAVLFAVGASLVVWNEVRSIEDVETILLFSCLCWINCVAIEQWEGKKSGWPIDTAAIAVAAAALILLHQHRPVLSAAETASALAFVFLDRRRHRFTADGLRVLADVALLSPILFLPMAGMRA